MTTRAVLSVAGLAVAVLLVLVSIDAFTDITTIQQGYRGVGMELVYDVEQVEDLKSNYEMPAPLPEASTEGALASEAYENVQVLGNLTTGQFTRLMTAITQWVSPEQGCNYCHNANNLASDEVYTKVVSRRMIQMTQYINENWTENHVKNAGVTCYTCHRGKNVPEYIWFDENVNPHSAGLAGDNAEQNQPGEYVALASLPADPFSPFLEEDYSIRVQGNTALPTGNRSSIKQAEWTYGLMMHMSESMGVNCTYCHNSRAFGNWTQSPPPRASAWYGIRMVRQLNNEYLIPLKDEYPRYRLGPEGDAPKTNCTTCHQGAYKPLLGANMLEPYPSLSETDYYAEQAAAYRKKKAEEKAAAEAAAEAEAEAEAEGTSSGDEVDDMFEPADG
jgi:photosynthetic reaction center cytochrome c subunit